MGNLVADSLLDSLSSEDRGGAEIGVVNPGGLRAEFCKTGDNEKCTIAADGTITYGVATAEDCGGAIQGNRIDLFFDTYDECIQFGVRDCDVYLLA